MNRRNVLTAILTSLIAWLFTGRKFGKASPRAAALAHNGIISIKRTPWALGAKVYVNGKLIPRVVSVNTVKGYVLALGEQDGQYLGWLNKRRIYGWIDIDDSDCRSGAFQDTRTQSITSECG